MKNELREEILKAYREAKAAGHEENSYGFPWQQTTYGPDGRTLYVHERPDRPGSVRVRWQLTDDEQAARDEVARPSPSVRLPEPLRDKRGRLRKKAADRAVEAAKEEYEEWLNPSKAAGATAKAATLEDVFRYFLDPETGAAMTDDHRYDVGDIPPDPARRAHTTIIDTVLGLDTAPSDIGMASARRLWRSVAAHYDHTGKGGTAAEKVVATLISALNHAREDEIVPPTDGLIPEKWREKYRTDWMALTGVSLSENAVSRESHTEEEAAKIVQALPQADPRIRVAFHIGAGFRVGQMSAYLTRAGIHEGGVFGLYAEFADRKSGEVVRIELPPSAQREWRRATESGHLRELEAAYQSGKLADYYVVPGGQMKNGACQVKHAGKPLNKRSVLKFFHELEEAAGVEHIDGRSWHGLRRAFETLVGRHTNSPDARDKAGGWTIGGGTRGKIYTQKEEEALTAEAARARAAALADVSDAASPAERAEDLAAQARLLLKALTRAAEDTGDDELSQHVAAATESITRAETQARKLSGEAPQKAGPALTREELEEKHREETAAAIREEIERRGLTGKAAAEIAGVSPSYISAVVNGKSSGTVATETLEGMLEALQASPETAD